MARKIDWLYARKGCTTCKKATGYMDELGTAAKETVDATKNRMGPDAALGLLEGVSQLVAVRGKKVEKFDLKKDRPADDVLLGYLMGPTGNLRAPTARVGKTMIVGFNEEAYSELLGE